MSMKLFSKVKSTKGITPNGWGRQDYVNQIVKKKEFRLDHNNMMSKVGWIRAYTVMYFEGLQTKF